MTTVALVAPARRGFRKGLPPSAPTSFALGAPTSSTIPFTLDEHPDATAIRVYYAVGADPTFASAYRDFVGAIVDGELTGFAPGTAYRAFAVAIRNGVRSAPSSIDEATTAGGPASLYVPFSDSAGGDYSPAAVEGSETEEWWDLEEDFATYSSTSNMIADPRGIYRDGEDVGTGKMVLDTTVGYGDSDRSMRYDYSVSASEEMITRWLNTGDVTELWVEAILKVTPGMDFNAGGGFKMLHLPALPDGIGRFGVNCENGNSGTVNADADLAGVDYEANHITGPGNSNVRSGEPFRVRRHVFKSGSNWTHRFWFDDTYVGSRTMATSATHVYGVQLCRNFNETPNVPTSLWWLRVRVSTTTDPGWPTS